MGVLSVLGWDEEEGIPKKKSKDTRVSRCLDACAGTAMGVWK
jgi:hypothetical protein